MRTTLLFLMALLLVLGSCTDGGSQSGESNWRTGSEGIKMNFVSNSPPAEVLNGQEVNVIVEYTNKGAQDLYNAFFYLTGYDSTILPFTMTDSPSLPLYGKSAFNPDGSYSDFVGWRATANPPSDVDSLQQDILVTACYSYSTIANPEICIDPKKYEYTDTASCSFDVRNLGSSQGGPIAVSAVKSKTTSDKIILEIHFENKGGGISFTQGLDNCHVNLEIKNSNTFNVQSVSLSGGRSFICKPGNPIRLTNGKGFIICEMPISGNSYYVSPLMIHLQYNYRQSISKQITVVNIG
ncbi:hypothetical protein JXC34_01305 [Candidatus Woesearchaeota archaeon]|nr:hypothetical protein [Candidatus Woesearchaeota archaeon]